MFINKAAGGKNNLCGGQVARRRVAMGISQRQLADLLQLGGAGNRQKRRPAH